MSIEDRVKKIVSDQLGKSVDEIQSDSSFVDDLGADSLDTVELVMALEDCKASSPNTTCWAMISCRSLNFDSGNA